MNHTQRIAELEARASKLEEALKRNQSIVNAAKSFVPYSLSEEQMTRLGSEFEKVWDDNVDVLYEPGNEID